MSWNPPTNFDDDATRRRRKIEESIRNSVGGSPVEERQRFLSSTPDPLGGVEESAQQLLNVNKLRGISPNVPQPPEALPTVDPNVGPQVGPFHGELQGPATYGGGANLKGLSPLQRNLQHQKALSTADADSEVSLRGDILQVKPPQQMPRWKSALLGAAHGAMMSNADTNAGVLSGIATGVAGGLISPRAVSEMVRRQEIERIQREAVPMLGQQGALADINYTQQRPELQRAEIERQINKDERGFEMDELREEGRNKRTGMIVGQREQDRITRQREGSLNRENRVQTARIRSSSTVDRGSTKGIENRAKRTAASSAASAAQQKGDDAVKKREAVDTQIAKLQEDMRKLPPKPATPYTEDPQAAQRQQYTDQINRLQQESQYWQTEADNAFSERDKKNSEAMEHPEELDMSSQERQIRKQAEKDGKDPDAVVNRMRQRGLL